MKKSKRLIYAAIILIVCVIIAATVLVPELISRKYDRTMLGRITLEEKTNEVAGYKYNLSTDERLYILSNALSNRVLPQSDNFAATRQGGISNIQTQSYAFQPVYRESEYNSETRAEAMLAVGTELATLSEKGIIPALGLSTNTGGYEATLFSAIDILEPQKSVNVWQISFSGAIIQDGLVDCIIDAQTHKIYSVSIRSATMWEQYDTDEIIRLWAEYLGTNTPEAYTPGSPLLEDATHYQKYAIGGMDGDRTIVTIGYYDGIREFFIKIAR